MPSSGRPDASKIAYVSLNDSRENLQWRVIDLTSGADRELVDFIPSSEQLTWYAFFDQYVQSHRVWSPDSRSLLFAGALVGDGGQAEARYTSFTWKNGSLSWPSPGGHWLPGPTASRQCPPAMAGTKCTSLSSPTFSSRPMGVTSRPPPQICLP